jgi:hypothetical protein
MAGLKSRIVTAALLFFLVFGASIFVPGSSLMMRGILGFVLILGLLGSVFFVARIHDVGRRWYQLLIWFLATMFILEFLICLISAKCKLPSGLYFVDLAGGARYPQGLLFYIAGIGFFYVLALAHGAISRHLSSENRGKGRA